MEDSKEVTDPMSILEEIVQYQLEGGALEESEPMPNTDSNDNLSETSEQPEFDRIRSSFAKERLSTTTLPLDDDDEETRVVSRKLSKEYGIFSHTKHVFILSWSAKPIFTRYGDENSLASFMGVISAIISNMQSGNSDQIRSMVAGNHKFVFLIRGPMYLVGVSSKQEDSIPQMMVELDFVYLQIISILTAGAMKVLETRPTYDLRKLIGGTEGLLHAIINDFASSPVYLLKSVESLRLDISKRQKISAILKLAAVDSNILFAALLSGSKLVHLLEHQQKHNLHPIDLIIMTNFIQNLASLRNSESWTPICLPKFNSQGFLYAHVSYVVEEVALVLLTTDPSGFYSLQNCRNYIVDNLQQEHLVASLLEENCLSLTIAEMNIACPEFLHFLYKSEYGSQFIQPMHIDPYTSSDAKKQLFHLFKHLHSQVNAPKLPHSIYFEENTYESALCLVSIGNYEFYGIFSPLVSKEDAHTAAHKALNWIHRHESSLFVTSWPKRNQ